MNCENCNQDHSGEYGSGRFCGAKCARSFSSNTNREETNRKVSKTLSKDPNWEWNPKTRRKTCLYCANPLIRSQLIYCSLQCCANQKTKVQFENWQKGEELGYCQNTYGTKRFIKKYIRKKYNNQCTECGWNKTNPHTKNIPLEIHHIDGDRSNNNEENLTLLCPNCHSLTNNDGVYNTGTIKKY